MTAEDKILWFDLETAGLDPLRNPITQFAGIVTDGELREIEALEIKIKFDRSMAEESALAMNGFDPEVWERDGVAPSIARQRIADFARRHATLQKISARGKPYTVVRMAGHNVRFDAEFMESLAEWLEIPYIGSHDALIDIRVTVEVARKFMTQLGLLNP